MRPIDADVLVDMLQHLEDKLDKKAFHDVDFQAAYISGVVQEIKNRVIETPTLDYAQKHQWISVKDRLPEESTADDLNWVLAVVKGTNEDPDIFPCYLMDGEWGGFGDQVTHWMEMPELPKED